MGFPSGEMQPYVISIVNYVSLHQLMRRCAVLSLSHLMEFLWFMDYRSCPMLREFSQQQDILANQVMLRLRNSSQFARSLSSNGRNRCE